MCVVGAQVISSSHWPDHTCLPLVNSFRYLFCQHLCQMRTPILLMPSRSFHSNWEYLEGNRR